MSHGHPRNNDGGNGANGHGEHPGAQSDLPAGSDFPLADGSSPRALVNEPYFSSVREVSRPGAALRVWVYEFSDAAKTAMCSSDPAERARARAFLKQAVGAGNATPAGDAHDAA